jgi:aminoglycoside phosphotransferase family enzyme
LIPEAQRPVAALLRRLAGGAAPLETRVSAVFVGPGAAYKLKKAVDLGFLDFSAPAARGRFARHELAINRRIAPEIYRDVLPVTRAADGTLELGGDGEAVDWVLRMAPVPASDFLDAVAARGELTSDLLDRMADAVAAMHAAQPPVAGVDAPASMGAALEGTRRAALAASLPADRIGAWAAAAAAALEKRAPLLAARAASGRVRRCHGDLHLKNLCLWRGRVTPFDALEFDETLATVDVGYDLAFLLMDLEHRLGGRAAANRVLNRYVARTGDAGLVAALPPWLALRAAIRAHAEGDAGGGAVGLRYLAMAEAALRPPSPCLLAVGGLPGTGKTRLARPSRPNSARRRGRWSCAPTRSASAGTACRRKSAFPRRPTRRRRTRRSSPNSRVSPEKRCAAARRWWPTPPFCGPRSAPRSKPRQGARRSTVSGCGRRSTCYGRGWRREPATLRMPPWRCWKRPPRATPARCPGTSWTPAPIRSRPRSRCCLRGRPFRVSMGGIQAPWSASHGLPSPAAAADRHRRR